MENNFFFLFYERASVIDSCQDYQIVSELGKTLLESNALEMGS